MTLILKTYAGAELPPYQHNGPLPNAVFCAGILYTRAGVMEGRALYIGPATLIEIPAAHGGGL